MNKKLEYKFIKLPEVSIKKTWFKNINDIRISELNATFNEMSKDGWTLVEIYWMEGLALLKKEV